MRPAPAVRGLLGALLSVVFVVALIVPSLAMADLDLPPLIVVQGIIKVDNGRVDMLVRAPLVLLSGFPLQRRGPGYIELSQAGPKLKLVAASIGRQIELSADGVVLAPVAREMQLSMLSDRSFASYATALSHLQGPPLPENTDLFWNQGFFDVHYEYALPAGRPDMSVRVNVAPELGPRVRVRLDYLVADEPARSFEVAGNTGSIPLDPRWHEAAWLFAKAGFVAAFAVDRIAFILCLAAPFRRFRDPLTALAVFIALQTLTLTAAVTGALADVEVAWLPLLSAAILAGSLVLLGIANLASPTVRRRWLLAAAVGGLGGFGLNGLLTDTWQFIGAHQKLAVVAFEAGVALGEVAILAAAFVTLRLLFARILGPLLGVVVLSALLAHMGWHGMLDSGSELVQQTARLPLPNLWAGVGVIATWLAPAFVVGVIGYLLPRRFDGDVGPTLVDALRARRSDVHPRPR